MNKLAERFMRYVQVDTQSDPDSDTFPSTAKQRELANVLVSELIELGIQDAHVDEWGYVYATIPSNSDRDIPVICFCSHMDTAPDCSGANVKPILHTNYQGQDISLPDDPHQIISAEEHSYLKKKIGEDIITASGKTLLGADNKAGIAIIMQLTEILVKNSSIKHGVVKILFTPDEEVGRGVEHVDLQKLGADFAYTLDGGERGALEVETFNADGVEIIVHGVIAHPGYAKGKMINAIKVLSEFIDSLPENKWSPETTEGKEGFVHPTDIRGTAERASVKFIIRDFETAQLSKHAYQLESLLKKVLSVYPQVRYEFIVKEQYRNMKDIIDQYPRVSSFARQAIKTCGIEPIELPVRGGTDGSRLSFMGLPCPNIFTGEMALHSRHEYVSVQDMEASLNVLIELLKIWESTPVG